jgi:hypothetical protein
MKTFEITVTVFVQGDDAKDALDHLAAEFDYICGCDNQILAVSYPDAVDVMEEKEPAN